MIWTINYHTGAGDRVIIGTLDDAMQAADDGAAYTQQDITIEWGDGNAIARRTWYGVPYDPEIDLSDNPICIGGGYYSDWETLMDYLLYLVYGDDMANIPMDY